MDPGQEQLAEWRVVQRRRIDAALPRLGHHCVHGATVPTCALELDHLVVGPGGSFLVVDRHFADDIRKGFDGRVWSGGHPIEADLDAAHTAAASLAAVLGDHVSSVLAVHGAEVQTPPVVRGIYLIAGRDVAGLIEARPAHRSPAEVAHSVARARAVLSGGEWTAPPKPSGSAVVAGRTTRPPAPARGARWRSWLPRR